MPAATFAGTIDEKTVPTSTAEAIYTGGGGITATDGVLVQAPSGNTASIYVGPSGVTIQNGIEITPGAAVFLPITNPAAIFVISVSGSQKVRAVAI